MQDAAYFREKATQCRRLAAGLSNQSDPTAVALLRMAGEFDAKARELETGTVKEASQPSRDEEAP